MIAIFYLILRGDRVFQSYVQEFNGFRIRSRINKNKKISVKFLSIFPYD